MSNSLDPYSNNIDKRINFTNYIKDRMKGHEDIIRIFNSKLDITVFRAKFNKMLMGLSELGYNMHDMIIFYYGTESTESVESAESTESTEWTIEDFLVNQLNSDNKNNLSGFILKMIIDCLEKQSDTSDIIVILKTNLNSKPTPIKDMTDQVLEKITNHKIHDLYDYIVEVENEEIVENVNDKFIVYYIKNFFVINILKYFFLSEMLLRALLDTAENVDGNCSKVTYDSYNTINDCNIIKNDYNDENNNLGMKEPENTDLSTEEMTIKIIYKILKDIHFINDFFKNNHKNLLITNTEFINSDNIILTDETELNTLNKEIDEINKNITELNLKNLNIQKDFEKKKNMYYIIIVFIIIYIFSNLYIIFTQNINSLLTLNILLIILIVVVKFLSLIKKSYQTLVQDL
jgi:hypothetical protein